jgi:hypothetical protein
MDHPFAAWPGWLQLLAGLALAGLGVLGVARMAPAGRALKAIGGPGIVAFELAGSTQRSSAILAQWGADGQAAARRSLRADYFFIVGYAGVLSLLAACTSAALGDKTWDWMAAAGNGVAYLALLAGLCDVAENLLLTAVLDRAQSGELQPYAGWARRLALAKFCLVLAVVAWIVLVTWPGALMSSGGGGR